MTGRSVRFPLGSRVTIDALADDPYPLFHELRTAEPVTWAPELGMWLLTRRDDVLGVLADWERFTTDSPASTIRDIFGSHMLTTDGDAQIRYKRRFIGPFRRGRLEKDLLGTVGGVLDDLMEDLEGERGGGQPDPLTEAEMIANLLIVLFGGIETTESMIGNALWAALSHPAIARTLAANPDPAMIEGVIEESMRWEPAVQSCTRFTTEAVEIRGVEISAGETVQCMLGAANRDPAHFPDPDRFDPDRPNARDHLAFGAGRHFCLGASLARIEAEQALARVFGALPGVRLDLERAARPCGHEFRTSAAVWVRWG